MIQSVKSTLSLRFSRKERREEAAEGGKACRVISPQSLSLSSKEEGKEEEEQEEGRNEGKAKHHTSKPWEKTSGVMMPVFPFFDCVPNLLLLSSSSSCRRVCRKFVLSLSLFLLLVHGGKITCLDTRPSELDQIVRYFDTL
jgi:hypothetical protein